MRLRAILLLSLLLNVALAYFALRSSPPTPAPLATPAVSARKTNKPPIAPSVVVRRQAFHWNEVETNDFVVFIKNLKAIGCPDKTIRHIIVGDVDEIFAERRARDVVRGEQQWWKSEPDMDVLEGAATAALRLDQERRALLNQLLGPNWDVPHLTTGEPAQNLDGPVLGDLPTETRAAIARIEEGARDRLRKYQEKQGQAGQPLDPKEVASLREATQRELAEILTPPALEEYLLRFSATAERMRDQMQGFNATPEEFRNIFRVRNNYDHQLALLGEGTDPATRKRRTELERLREDSILQMVGTERYNSYHLHQDADYREARESAEMAGAPAEKVMPIYQVQRATAAELARIRDDTSLNEADRAAALLAAQALRDQSVRQILRGGRSTTNTPPLPTAAQP